METSFRFQAKNVFLTYPNAGFNLSEFIEHWRPNAKYIIISSELHADGNPHRHAFIQFARKLSTRNARFFDWLGKHPNITVPKSIPNVLDYIRKDGEFLEWGDSPVKLTWGDIIRSSTSDTFLQAVSTSYPKEFVLQYERLEYFKSKYFSTPAPTIQLRSRDMFRVPDTMNDWVTNNLDNLPERPISLHLYGPTRTGKTEWARSLGPHIYWNGMIDISTWDNSATYMILDDFDWEFIPNKKGLIGCQKQIVLTDKYRKKMSVTWGKPVILIANENFIHDMKATMASWFESNCQIVRIANDLY